MVKVRLGIIGSAFSSNLHAEALGDVPEAAVVAVCSPNRKHAEEFARKWKIECVDTDYRKLLERKDIDAVDVCTPNNLHAEICLAAAAAG